MPKKKEQAKPEKNKRQLQAEQTKRALMKAAMALFAQEVMHLAHGIIYDWCMADNAFDLKKEGHRVFKQLAKTTVL